MDVDNVNDAVAAVARSSLPCSCQSSSPLMVPSCSILGHYVGGGVKLLSLSLMVFLTTGVSRQSRSSSHRQKWIIGEINVDGG